MSGSKHKEKLVSRKYYDVVYSYMGCLGAAKLAGVVMAISIVAISGINLAYAEQPCGEQAYVYNVGCLPLDTAHMVGGVIVASLIVFAIAWGVAERHYHMVPNFK